MIKDTITLALNGDVPLHLFAEAMTYLSSLVDALADDVGVADKVKWYVDDLQPGSAIVTMRGESDVEKDVERVVFAYGDLGQLLASGQHINYSNRVITAATAITGILNGCITSVRFETSDIDAIVDSPSRLELVSEPVPFPRKAIGAVKGQIETISKHGGLRFNLFDTTYNRAVSCYLDIGKEDTMREMWGKSVIVEGDISRDNLERPVVIRHITDIREFQEGKRGSYLAARGVAPRRPGTPRPEVTLRKLRDA